MEISYNIHSSYVVKGRETQAVYLQGWIAAQLGWALKSFSLHDSEIHVDYHNEGHDIHVVISAVQDTTAPEDRSSPFSLLPTTNVFIPSSASPHSHKWWSILQQKINARCP